MDEALFASPATIGPVSRAGSPRCQMPTSILRLSSSGPSRGPDRLAARTAWY